MTRRSGTLRVVTSRSRLRGLGEPVVPVEWSAGIAGGMLGFFWGAMFGGIGMFLWMAVAEERSRR
jgi:hypothetical protein